MSKLTAAIVLLSLTLGCSEATGPDILDAPDRSAMATEVGEEADPDDGTLAEGAEEPSSNVEPETASETPGPAQPSGTMSGSQPSSPSSPGPPATTKSQMSYIFVAHPDDEFESWSVIEGSSANYHVFVLLTRGGHTGYCETPASHPNTDQYTAVPRDSEACKANRIRSFHRFLNRAAATDRSLDVLAEDSPDVSDVDPTAGRFDAWVGPNSARVVFDFPDGGLEATNLVAANALVRSMKGVVLPDLPDYQALAGSFWNANYPDCIVYDHPDHRAVHVGVWENDLETTVRRGRTCATDPDAAYFRRVSDATWRVIAGSPDYLQTGVDPGIFRESYAWLNGTGWEMSEGDTTFNARSQSFWELR